MYHFSYFKDKNQQRIRDFMGEYPFAFLTGSFLDGTQVATQVPVLVFEKGGDLFLQGHLMRNTDHHKAFIENPKALVVFSGPHAYVSASWYQNPHLGSTWNYMSVHASGFLRFMTDEELVTLMKKLTLHFEKGNLQSPTYYENLPEDYIKSMMPAIVGFEIKVEKLDHVFKLSQNRDEISYQQILSNLEKLGGNSALIAKEMQKRQEELFPQK